MERIVEVSRDVLGWVLIYVKDHGVCREGDPVGEPDYYKSRAAAARAAKRINELRSEAVGRDLPGPKTP